MSLRLRPGRFDGSFASASLFHVPPDALSEVLSHLHTALRAQSILYALNPRGRGPSGWAGDRYCTDYSLAPGRGLLRAAGFRARTCEPRPIWTPISAGSRPYGRRGERVLQAMLRKVADRFGSRS